MAATQFTPGPPVEAPLGSAAPWPQLPARLATALPALQPVLVTALADAVCEVLADPCEAVLAAAAQRLQWRLPEVAYSSLMAALRQAYRPLRQPALFGGRRDVARHAAEALRLLAIELKRRHRTRGGRGREPRHVVIGDAHLPLDAVGWSDAAVVDGQAAVGLVLLDVHGACLHQHGRFLGPCSPAEAEWRAFAALLEEASARSCCSLLAQVDAHSVLARVRRLPAPAGLRRLHVVRVPRLFNQRADALARQALAAV